MNAPFTIVVSAGTYHLPFDRLIDWIAPWAEQHPRVRMIVQHGPSRTLPGADNHVMFAAAELAALYRTADVIVLQGGAGGVMDAAQAGRKPIVVPRIPVHDEVVDNHQLVFTAQVAELGIVHRADTADVLHQLLDDSLAGTLTTRTDAPAPAPGVANAVAVLGTLPAARSTTVRLRRLVVSLRLLLTRR